MRLRISQRAPPATSPPEPAPITDSPAAFPSPGSGRGAASVLRRALLGTTLAAVLAATLSPLEGEPASTAGLCLLCGERGLADAVTNVLLFVPLGLGIGLIRPGGLRGVLAAAALSTGIELAQFALPGRDPTLGDVVFNSVGAAVGVLIVRDRRIWATAPPTSAARFSLLAACGVVAVTALVGILLQPALPRSVYFGQWAPALGHLQEFRGRVLRAMLAERPLPAVRLPSDSVRQRLLAGESIDVLAVAGPRTTALAPILSIYDHRRREILLLGADGNDLVLRRRTRAAQFRLDQPVIRAPGLLATAAEGDTLRIRVIPGRETACLAANSRIVCGLGHTVGSGWTLLFFPESPPLWVRRLLSLGWIAALTVPVGFWLRVRWESLLALALLAAALYVLPPRVSLLRTPPLETTGALLGLASGVLLRGAANRAASGAAYARG